MENSFIDPSPTTRAMPTATQYKHSPSRKFLDSTNYLQKAKYFLQNKQWRSAQLILEKSFSETKPTALVYHLLGLAFYHQGLFHSALSQFQKACDKESRSEYFLNLSIALNEMGHYKEAQKAYQKALLLKGQSDEQSWKIDISNKHNQTAGQYLKKNYFKYALEEYIKGLRFYAQPTAQLQIAKILWKLNQKTSAQKYLEGFICLQTKNVPARLLLAEWYFEQNQVPKAVNEWETILKIDPKNQTAYNCLLKTQQFTD